LIVGGSRGLGELTAKLVAAGGGEVVVTWQSGKDDAARVAAEIREAGGSCDILAYDARKPAAEQLATLGRIPTHLYYFATQTIFRHQAEIFDAQRLREFLAIYVDGFWDIARILSARQPALSILYPSSIFVDDAPKGMTEYAMAKAAGERLCSDMNKFMAPLHVTAVRLPRLLTDQTAGVTPSETADPLAVLLPVIRHVQSGTREAFRAPG
jgi:NAD(P)-dependent dehydrogenase (short-subunit alcohol dehydrogenase family)